MTPTDARAGWLAGLRESLEARRRDHLLRQLHQVQSSQGPALIIDGKNYVQFCTNNYLGLAADPEIIDAAREALDRYGAGAGASRLVAGSMSLHHTLETELARFKGTGAALLFPTGFMANLAVLTTFAGAGDLVVSDKLNHASLLDAARFSGATHRTFPHRGYRRAQTLLTEASRELDAENDQQTSSGGTKFLATDSLFSMDGDLADLLAACEAAERCGALLVIDEAHATGVLGAQGRGVGELQDVEDRVALSVGTLSKALGSMGGFVAGPREAIDTLINHARSFIYTTALPPACAAAALAALRIVEREPPRRQRLMRLAAYVKSELQALGFSCGDSASPIIPVLLGDAGRTLLAAQRLREKGIYVPAIRPPTVPPNSSRLRISLMATHNDGQVQQLLEAMGTLRDLLPDR